MAKITYIEKRFSKESLRVIQLVEGICAEYQRRGYDMTLRQAYYQMVARGYIPNKDTEYKRLGSIINDARLAGLLDWRYIVDRTRNLKSLSHWDTPASIIDSAAYSYRRDKWATQAYRVEVWVEKDALSGVIAVPATELDVDYFSCRGYTSQSEVWGAAQRLIRYEKGGQVPVILHLGDHDPSGIDMSRDIQDRLALFMEYHGCNAPTFERLALNMDQVEQYNPPPNPAKLTDSRANGYIDRFGDESWELDALDPTVMGDLIREAVLRYRDEDAWQQELDSEADEKQGLETAARRWADVVTFLRNGSGAEEEDEEGGEQ